MIQEEIDELRDKIPDYLEDLLGLNFVMNEIDWDELGGHAEANEKLLANETPDPLP